MKRLDEEGGTDGNSDDRREANRLDVDGRRETDRIDLDDSKAMNRSERHSHRLFVGCSSDIFEPNAELDRFQNRRFLNLVWNLFEHPSSSIPAYLVRGFSASLAMIDVSIIVTYSLLGKDTGSKKLMMDIEFFCLCYFTFEFCVRFVSAPNRWLFVRSPVNMLDLLVNVSFVTAKGVYGPFNPLENIATSVQTLRVLKMLRILTTPRHSLAMCRLWHTLIQSLRILAAFFACFVTVAVALGTLLYLVELSPHPDREITCVPAGIFTAINTLTAVGFGTWLPVTPLGRFVASVIALLSLLVLATPVAIITQNFEEVCARGQPMPGARKQLLIPSFLAHKIETVDVKVTSVPGSSRTESGVGRTTPERPISMLLRKIRRLECELEIERYQQSNAERNLLDLGTQCAEYKRQVDFLLVDEAEVYLAGLADSNLDFLTRDNCCSGEEDEEDEPPQKQVSRSWTWLTRPYSRLSWGYTLGMLVLNLLSITMAVLGTLPGQHVPRLIPFHLVAMMAFALDFALRGIFSPSKSAFLLDPFNILEVSIQVAYFLGELNLRFGSRSFHIEEHVVETVSIFRVFRVLSIFRLSRFSHGMQALAVTVVQRRMEFGILGSYIVVGTTLISVFVYYSERGHPDTSFTSLGLTFYWAIVTITTVGYGEFSFQTSLGYLFLVVCTIFSLVVFVLPLGLVATTFACVYDRLRMKDIRRHQHQRYLDSLPSENLRLEEFLRYDVGLLSLLVQSKGLKHISLETRLRIREETREALGRAAAKD